MRMFQTEGLSREALQQVYEVVLTQKMVGEEKINRLKQELAVAICAIEDGKVKSLEQIKTGLQNLFIYCETHVKLIDILGEAEGQYKDLIKLDEELTKDLTLEQINKKVADMKGIMNTPPQEIPVSQKLHVVD